MIRTALAFAAFAVVVVIMAADTLIGMAMGRSPYRYPID